jgi:hypothetical protein
MLPSGLGPLAHLAALSKHAEVHFHVDFADQLFTSVVASMSSRGLAGDTHTVSRISLLLTNARRMLDVYK